MVSSESLLPFNQQELLILNGFRQRCSLHRQRSSWRTVRIYLLPHDGQWTRDPKIADFKMRLNLHFGGTCFNMCIQMDLVNLVISRLLEYS